MKVYDYKKLRDVTRKYLNYRRDNYNRKNRLNTSEFSKVINKFNKKLIDRIIFDTFEFKIYGLGSLGLRKWKPKKFVDGKISEHLSIDWAKTKKYNKRIYHMNEHTDGYKYGFMFTPSNQFKNINYFEFKMARRNSRYLANILKNPDTYGKIGAYLK